jgi:4-hydroxybenzoate polyprenyltransferase/phosphoserine phosphatase
MTTTNDIPLCIDLDGTLLRSDTLYESVLELLKHRPWLLFLLPIWLLAGKRCLKQHIAKLIVPDPRLLPYRDQFVEWARAESCTRPVYLITAAHILVARPIAEHLGFFSGVIASDEVNLSSSRKARVLADRFGEKNFDYAGNSHDDLEVWRHARHAIVVGASASVAARAEAISEVKHRFDMPRATLINSLMIWLRALRVYQWVKNLPIFLAPLAAHTLLEVKTLTSCLAAFLAFSLAASANYAINDLLDLSADRSHPRKCKRPFADGQLSVLSGMLVVPCLGAGALMIAWMINGRFFLVLLVYLAASTIYSMWLKRLLFIDVASLACLYTLRVVAGASAAMVVLSFWLLALCAYGFLSLALLKRYAELMIMDANHKSSLAGRAYRLIDTPVVLALGVGAGLVATVVMALYLETQTAAQLYAHPEVLWSLVGLMTLSIGHLWLAAGRGEMHDDPIVFIVRDPASLIIIGLAILSIVLAI